MQRQLHVGIKAAIGQPDSMKILPGSPALAAQCLLCDAHECETLGSHGSCVCWQRCDEANVSGWQPGVSSHHTSYMTCRSFHRLKKVCIERILIHANFLPSAQCRFPIALGDTQGKSILIGSHLQAESLIPSLSSSREACAQSKKSNYESCSSRHCFMPWLPRLLTSIMVQS